MYARVPRRYQRETHQLYRVRTTNSVAGRNRARERQAQQSGRRARLLDEALGFYSKTFICTHGWRPGASRGSGKRHHVLRSTSCRARLNALLMLVPEGGRDVYRVCVKSHSAMRNHEVGRDVYFSYAEVRKVTDAEVRRQTRRMWEEGAAVKDVVAYLREASGKPVRRKDVDNMVVRWRNGRDGEGGAEDEGSGDDWMEVAVPSEYRKEGQGGAGGYDGGEHEVVGGHGAEGMVIKMTAAGWRWRRRQSTDPSRTRTPRMKRMSRMKKAAALANKASW